MPAAGSSPAPAAATAPAATAAAAEPQLASAAEAAESAAAGPPRVAAAPARARVRAYDDVERTGGTVAAGAEERVAMAMPPPPPLAPPAMAPPPSPVSAPAADYAVAEVAAADRSFAAPDSLVLKGQVTDRTGQGVAAAQVRAPGVGASTVTRADGSYALSIPTSRLQGRDTVSVRVARVGMEAQTRTLALGRADTLDFALRPSAIALESVISKADAERSKPGAGAPAAAASTAQAPARRERPRAGEWVAVERREAEALLGQRLLTLPGRPVVGLEMGEVQGQSVVRVRQALEDGKVLSILLQRDSGAPASAAVELERVRQGGVTMRQGSLIILLSGPFTPESLGSYGRRLRP